MRIGYLDIETSYMGKLSGQRLFSDHKNHQITILGVRVLHEDRDLFTQLMGKDVTKTALLSLLGDLDLIVTYNGRSIPDKIRGYIGFDFPVIAAQLGVVLDQKFRHLDLCPACWEHGLWGGQKAIEKTLRLKRQLPGKDGAWADITWKKYEKTGSRNLLDELLQYNREDVFMLRRIHIGLQKLKKR